MLLLPQQKLLLFRICLHLLLCLKASLLRELCFGLVRQT